MRGVASAQVVLLHYVTAFFPGLGLLLPSLVRYRWERIVADTPLFFVLNGYAAVYLFFLLSGSALTFSFERHPFAVGWSLAARIIRLGVPMAAAILLGALLIVIWPSAHVAVGKITGSVDWLSAVSPRSVTLKMILHQIIFEGMLTDYEGASFWPHSLLRWMKVDSLGNSFDAPLWTLHVEFVGSILIMMLVALRQVLWKWAYFSIAIVLGVILIASPLVMFIVGHLVAPVLLRKASNRLSRIIGCVSVAGGIVLCSGHAYSVFNHIESVLPKAPLGNSAQAMQIQIMVAEIMIFLGVSQVWEIRAVLASPVLQRLGRISFSLYLTHFPLLFTIVCGIFLLLNGVVSYMATIIICFCVGLPISLLLAVLFERFIDRPAIHMSRIVFRRGVQRSPVAAFVAPSERLLP